MRQDGNIRNRWSRASAAQLLHAKSSTFFLQLTLTIPVGSLFRNTTSQCLQQSPDQPFH